MSSGKPLKGRKELRREERARYSDLMKRSMEAELSKISAMGVWGDPEASPPDGAILMSGKWVHTWKVSPEEAEAGVSPVVKSRFCHVGMKVTKCEDGFMLDQLQYAQSLEPLSLGSAEDDCLFGDPDGFARLTGQLLWLAHSRPDLSFRISRLAAKVAAPLVSDAKSANE
eukprot:gene17882-biopygen5776